MKQGSKNENKIFGDFLVIKRISVLGEKNSRWLCRCLKCGEEKIFSNPSLKALKGIICTKSTLSFENVYIEHLKKKIKKQKNITKNGCWEWTGPKYKDGYGMANYRRKKIRAHRLSYQLFVGEITENICVLHKCDNKPCFNPNHLFLGTRKDNAIDMVRKGRHGTKK